MGLWKFAGSEIGLKVAGVLAAVVVIASFASFGATGKSTSNQVAGGSGTETTQDLGVSQVPGTSTAPDAGRSNSGVTPGTRISGVVPNRGNPAAIPPALRGVDFGLKTQGVTNKSVLVGVSNNYDNCGDTASLAEQAAPGVVGDPKKAFETFAKYVNEHGGIGGRQYKLDLVDDGAGGGGACQDRQMAAAIKMADQDKVFLALPGLHVESDYIIKKHVPVWGGRDDPTSLQKYGANGFQLTEPITPTIDAWASFGKYYLGTTDKKGLEPGCLLRIANGDSGNWDYAQKRLHDDFASFGISLVDEFTFSGDASQAANTANAVAIRERDKGCQHVYFLAGNPIGLIFITQAATANHWFPHKWTWTSYTALSDDDKIAKAMDQVQWKNAVGLSARVPATSSKMAGNCKRIWDHYNPGDGNNEAAWTTIACAEVLTTAEIMKRGIALTGDLTANSFVLGANAIKNDFFYDAHVPISYNIPGPNGPFKTRGFSHYTVAQWDASQSKYTFPKYPCYYKTFGPKGAGCENLSSYYK